MEAASNVEDRQRVHGTVACESHAQKSTWKAELVSKLLCNIHLFSPDAFKASTLLKKVLDACGLSGIRR